MEGVCDPSKAALTSDIVRAWRYIANGVTPATTSTREKYWRHWCTYCNEFKRHPFLRDATPIEQSVIITAFAGRVRTGFYGRGHEISVSSVAEALAAVSKTIELAGEQSPVYVTPDEYILPVKRCVEGMRRMDAPAVPQLAVPVSVPHECLSIATSSTKPGTLATADLIVIAFHYLLRVGEYTAPRFVKRNGVLVRATRTKQFRVKDVGFFANGKVLHKSSPLRALLQADAATLKITNQKNGRMGQTIHHEAFPSKFCPVKALARRIHHILANGGSPDSLICEYYDGTSVNNIQPTTIVTLVRQAAKNLSLNEAGIDIDLIGSHSLRAGGAMALKLLNKSDTLIMKMGRWSGLTFLQYIHNQIAHLSHNLASEMSTNIPFLNIASIG